MKPFSRIAYLLFAISLLMSLASYAGVNKCDSVHEIRQFAHLPQELSSHYRSEVQGLSKKEVSRLNQETLRSIMSFVPELSGNRAQAIPMDQVGLIMSATHRNSVVRIEAIPKYQPSNVEIGYCFGRAVYTHLMLLKVGLQKESIRKIWAVGPMQAPGGEIIWGFHVSTLAFTKENGWVAVDTNEYDPQPVEQWIKKYTGASVDGKVRFYITDANKFGLDLGPYDRVQMGLDLTREQDWYRNYFVDLLKSVREKSLFQMGLRKLNKPEPSEVIAPNPPQQKKRGVIQKLKDYFGF